MYFRLSEHPFPPISSDNRGSTVFRILPVVYGSSVVWKWHSDGYTLYICIHNLQEIHNMYTVGVRKPGEPDRGRQPSQPEPSNPGKGKMYNTSKQYKKTHHAPFSTNRQPSQPEHNKPEKIQNTKKPNTNKHTGINPVIRAVASSPILAGALFSFHHQKTGVLVYNT